MLTKCFVPIQSDITSQAVIEATLSRTATAGDSKQHLLQVCHRLTKKANRFQVADSCFLLAENSLTLAARQPILNFGDNVLVKKGICTFTIHFMLLRG